MEMENGTDYIPVIIQGVPSSRALGLGYLGFLVFHCLSDSARAHENLADLAGQLGRMVEHQVQSHPNPSAQAIGTPCR